MFNNIFQIWLKKSWKDFVFIFYLKILTFVTIIFIFKKIKKKKFVS